MVHQPYFPSFPLNQFVELFIYFDGIQNAHTVDRFLPNGDVEILIDFHDEPQFIYDNNSLAEIQACHRVWTSGVRTEPITIPSGTNAAMMVVAFKKGMAAPFFPFPMNEIADSVIDADQTSKRANGQNNWQRRKPGSHKRQADHVRLACAPITIEQCGRAFPIKIARPMHARTRVENSILYKLRHSVIGFDSPLHTCSLASCFFWLRYDQRSPKQRNRYPTNR